MQSFPRGEVAEDVDGGIADDTSFTAELLELLRALKLEGKLSVLQEWCKDEEVESFDEFARIVRKKQFGDALVVRLQLKPGRAKAINLLEMIAERAAKPATLATQMNGRI